MRAVIIGLGGIGTHLAEPLARLLSHSKAAHAPKRVVLVDGDSYEPQNRQRQRFDTTNNKAEGTKVLLEKLFRELTFEAKPHFVTPDNIFVLIRDGDVVFLAVDNHATRKAVSEHVSTLKNVLLISGGNELFDGNVQIYQRKEGKDAKPPLTWRHPEIENPKDRNPGDLNCGEILEAGGTQILATNLMVASLMLNIFTLWIEEEPIPYHEIYFDIKTGNVRPVNQWQT